MFTPKEVVRILAESREIQVELSYVQDVLKHYITDIEKRREEFRNRVQDVRLYSKRPRLEELSWMYTQMKLRYKALNSTELITRCSGRWNRSVKRLKATKYSSTAPSTSTSKLKSAFISNKPSIKSINLKEIILGRVAARMNWSLPKLIAGLHNSYYARFTPANEEYDPEAEMEYPSTMNYDSTASSTTTPSAASMRLKTSRLNPSPPKNALQARP